MSKRGENIRKRKDGRWEGRYMKGRKPTGEIIYGSVYGKTYKEVREKTKIALQHSEPNMKTKEILFCDVIKQWQDSNRIRIKGATDTKYSYLIDSHILPSIGGLKLSEITGPIINAFLLEKAENGRLDGTGGLSASYVRSLMIIIKSVIQFAVDEQLCMPLKSPIYKPQKSSKELTILTVSDQKRIEEAALNDLTPTKAGILISLYTGLRIGEICALTWDDVDLKVKIIHVRHTIARVKNRQLNSEAKTNLILDEPKTFSSKRDIPIPSFLCDVLLQLKKKSVSSYVVSEKNEFVSPRTFEYRYHKILETCNVQSINFHALRHTFATRCIEVGVDVKSLSEILGHANVSITLNTYVHSSIDLKRIQLERLPVLVS